MNQILITAPNRLPYKIFLAGGISNCFDWQKHAVEMLFQHLDMPHIVINPRRYDFDITKEEMSSQQIEWEHRMLKTSDLVLFWFPKETLCPITLFELGAMSYSNKRIVVGCHSKYKRKFDVEKQLSIQRPGVFVHEYLSKVIEQVVIELKNLQQIENSY